MNFTPKLVIVLVLSFPSLLFSQGTFTVETTGGLFSFYQESESKPSSRPIPFKFDAKFYFKDNDNIKYTQPGLDLTYNVYDSYAGEDEDSVFKYRENGAERSLVIDIKKKQIVIYAADISTPGRFLITIYYISKIY